MFENMPFAFHRFILEIKASSGLSLLESWWFYGAVLLIIHKIFGFYEELYGMLIYALDAIDSLGIFAFIAFTAASHVFQVLRERRLQR